SCEGSVNCGASLPTDGVTECDSKRGTSSTTTITTSSIRTMRSIESSSAKHSKSVDLRVQPWLAAALPVAPAAKIRAIEYDGRSSIPLGENQKWLKPKLTV